MLIIPCVHGRCPTPLMSVTYLQPRVYSSILSSILEENLIPTVNPCYDLHPRRKITWRHAPSIVLRTLQGVLFNPIIFMTFLGILVNVIVYFGVNKQVGVRQLPGNNDCC